MCPTFSRNTTILTLPLLMRCLEPITCRIWETKTLLRGKRAVCANNRGRCRIVASRLGSRSRVSTKRTLSLLRTKEASRNPKVLEIHKGLSLIQSRCKSSREGWLCRLCVMRSSCSICRRQLTFCRRRRQWSAG
jgi:hypothetical protein